MLERILHLAGERFFTRPAHRKSLDELRTALMRSGEKLQAHFEKLPDTEMNRRALSHIIGIERWGQRRLHVTLGEPFLIEEYDRYRPARDTGWADLKTAFAATRAETTALAAAIDAADGGDLHVLHNSWGQMTARGWLRYLDVHANLESRRMR